MLQVEGLEVGYGHGRSATRVLDNVSFTVTEGRTLGVVGESGSGKSTLAKAIVGAIPVRAGTITIADTRIDADGPRHRIKPRRDVQLIPQDPYSSLDPRQKIGDALAEAMRPTRPRADRDRVEILRVLDRVRVPAAAMDRYPHEFSGGQRQRIAIARGLMASPRIIIADEITSALDVSIQADILLLLDELRRELGLTMVFISHNLAVVRNVSDEVAVMQRGRIVETGSTADLYRRPQHAYTRLLLDSDPGSPRFSLEQVTSPTEEGRTREH